MKKKFLLFFLLALSGLLLTSGIIDLNELFNYANQPIPGYILKDNTPPDNPITDKGATLGRVLFYDKKLSLDNTIACASCHRQNAAFGDTALLSQGINGLTARHSMRLSNIRFSDGPACFWDKRAATLEDQVTHPIKDFVEMGFSGANGQPAIDSLFRRMKNTNYYPELFHFVFGDPEITELRIQKALAQFVRSMQSFDSRFDVGRAQVDSDLVNFPNFTPAENEGKLLFLTPPQAGGAGCFRCHAAPEFSIDSASLNNGVVGVVGQPGAIDLTNTKSPSLRDVVSPLGKLNSTLMHTGEFTDLLDAINHYNYLEINPLNTNLDPRLAGPLNELTLSKPQKESLAAFLKTLTGFDIYVNEKWSNPFDAAGNITILPLITGQSEAKTTDGWQFFPNPVSDRMFIRIRPGNYQVEIRDAIGRLVQAKKISGDCEIHLPQIESGVYSCSIFDLKNGRHSVKNVIRK